MTFKILLLLIATCAILESTNASKCESVTQEDCETMTSEYEKYRECMERRTKRSADCYEVEESNCDKCNCNTCRYNTCENNCNNNCCEKCCQRSSCTTSNCCQQTCRAECRSNSCRTSCKRKCQDNSNLVSDSKSDYKSQHNITTVIHLKNFINNTNLINLPIKINTTVLNNITNEGRYGGSMQYTEGSKDKCCLTIGPRQCVPQNSFPFMRCYHLRKKSCGSICSAPVVHYQSHEICDNNVNEQQPCRQQMVYIPQPQPRCAYTSSWPYVTCGNQQLQSCDGCYSHYIKREDITKCSNFCYDDGYGVGPYYRQAPFYRPGFAHAASCYQTGLCGYDGFDTGAGFEGLSENGFPSAYPPQTYPFVIEDCENCTFSSDWDVSNPEHLSASGLANLAPPLSLNRGDTMLHIDATVSPGRSERYAEIRIKPSEDETSSPQTQTTI